MNQHMKVAGLSVAGLLVAGMTSSVSADTNRTTLCHVTNSSQTPVVVIEVADRAVPAHLAHGDSRAFVKRGDRVICKIVKPKGR